MEGGGAQCSNQTKDDDDFKDNDKNDNKDNNQLTTIYRRDAMGNVGAREGGKEGEGRVGKMTGGAGGGEQEQINALSLPIMMNTWEEPERRGKERKRGAE